MPLDRNRGYRLAELQRDGAACDRLTGRLRDLIADINFEAAQARDDATAEALKALANDLADAAHGPVSALAVAHDDACDGEGVEPFWRPDPVLCIAIGIQPDAPPVLTADDVAAAFSRAAE